MLEAGGVACQAARKRAYPAEERMPASQEHSGCPDAGEGLFELEGWSEEAGPGGRPKLEERRGSVVGSRPQTQEGVGTWGRQRVLRC